MLPTEKTPPKQDLADLAVLVYGPSKIGKTTWCSQAEGAVFLATEAGLNNLEVFQVPLTRWEEFLLACREIAEGKHSFRTVVIDTVDNAYRMCADYICAKFKIDHESDLGFGKGYALINNEFQRVLTKLSLLPYGLFLVSHSQEREIETRTGKHTRIVPTLPDKARKIVLGMVDLILYCDLEMTAGPDGSVAGRRVMRTKPHVNYEASRENLKWLKTDLHTCGLVLARLSELPANLERLLDVKLEITKRTKDESENVYFNKRIVTEDEGQGYDAAAQDALNPF